MLPHVYTLSDSITLRTVATDAFKSETISFLLAFPIEADRSPRRTLLFSLLKRGSEKYPTLRALNRRLDELYAAGIEIRNERRGDRHVLGFSAEMLNDRYVPAGSEVLDGTVELVSQMLLHPRLEDGHFPRSYVDNEKAQLCDIIRTRLNDPRAYATSRCREIMCEGEPFGLSLIGDEACVQGITDAELMDEYARLLSESSLEVFYVGATPPERVAALVRKHLGAFGGRRTPLPPDCTAAARIPPIEVCEEAPVSQGKLVMGFRVGARLDGNDFYPMLVANEILGGGPSSKLFLQVRERLGLCYYCSSSYYAAKGLMLVSAGIANERRDEVVREILSQLSALQRGEIAPSEWEGAIGSLTCAYRSAFDSPSAMEDYYYGRFLYGLEAPDPLASVPDKLARVTREDVIRAAATIAPDTVYFLKGTLPEGEEDDEYE